VYVVEFIMCTDWSFCITEIFCHFKYGSKVYIYQCQQTRTSPFHLKWLNKQKTTGTFCIRNLGPGLIETQWCDVVKPVNWILKPYLKPLYTDFDQFSMVHCTLKILLFFYQILLLFKIMGLTILFDDEKWISSILNTI